MSFTFFPLPSFSLQLIALTKLEFFINAKNVPADQVLFLVEIIEAGGFNQQQVRLAGLYRVSSPSVVRA